MLANTYERFTDSVQSTRSFDGVVCFGGVDWWYHNRGHYDLQMMQQLAREIPVLYVNSIGMRTPSPAEGTMYVRRMARKLRSLMRGRVQASERFHVLSPIHWPGWDSPLTHALLARQVSRAAQRAGIRSPLVWVACPAAAETALRMDRAGLVFQRTDRFESFEGIDVGRVRRDVQRLLGSADLSLYCSSALQQSENARNPRYIDHGVDLSRFAAASRSKAGEPQDLAGIPGPRVGFVGGIDAHTFDDELFRAVVARLPQAQFVLVGGRSLPVERLSAANVHLLGRKPYEQVPQYMAACDVLIMPWRRNEWIRACNPIKLKEYLAVGRPVVSTPFEELRRYRELVRVADNAEGFAKHIELALAGTHDPLPGQQAVVGQGWDQRAKSVLDALAESGIHRSALAARQS